MILPGSLRTTTLGDVLGQLHRGGVSGVLQIIASSTPWAGSHHQVTLVRGIVRDVSTTIPAPRIGEVLLEQGVLRQAEHELFVAELRRRSGALAGEVLRELGMVSDATLRFGLSRQMRKRLDVLYGIERASLRFHPLSAQVRTVASVALGPREFLHGRPRARDQAGARRPPVEPEREGRAGALEHERSQGRAAALELLGLPEVVTREQVRQAFRRAAVLVHPDLHRDLEPHALSAMQARFAELSQAYHLLITSAFPDTAQSSNTAAA